ncbi:membrane-bound PQQ-dependent dehydrogenase, glucose/quinate/shikimate family [Aureimonas leprariae]|uniref:Membrane-bound PQQ-dependent dehydrogenase, glucose/quinate/shikimate family n=1 Tax=Plantimonas leprariae TaxID=2615207 RepID=A0A7V7PKK3_9HYPH|nr:membrane-bound PQQ-dependent dehydrogenase, glucose/quinate/shikimate family [Aureimonas leprariae]KAB0676203.1 membrane-bound PQQ-dependent dehydrogenase, glucose/quinate/shikimate family [Aureimonas leprariae]
MESRPNVEQSEALAGRSQRPPNLFVRLVGLLLAIVGLGLLVAGGWLAALGGNWYYVLAGVGMLATGVLLFRGSPLALWVYAAVVLGTVGWAVAEIGFDWWQLVPRGDIVFLVGLLLLTPWITRSLSRHPGERAPLPWRGAGVPLALSLVVAAGVGAAALLSDYHTQPGTLPDKRASVAANYGGVPDGDWSAYGRSWHGNKWSPLDQVNPENVSSLEVAWSIRTGDMMRPGDPHETTYEVTPLKVGDTVYLCTPHDIVLALEAETGQERWRFDPKITVSPHLQHLTCRGVSYHDSRVPGAVKAPNGECAERLFLGTNDTRLFALDARTGQPCPTFGEGGQVNMWRGMPSRQDGWYQFTSAPLVMKGLVILAGAVYDNAAVKMPSGVIRAFDVATGRLVWNFDPGNPDQTAPIGPDQHYAWSSPNSWSTSSADEDLGLLYVPMGMGAVDQWGGERPETTERFATSVLALEIATGRVRWVHQTVHHDLWDMDVPSQPVLVDLDIEGKGRVPALAQSTKTGDIFVLDRRTGEPVHPIEERPVPGGAAPGDHTSPTQPFSSVSLRPEPMMREADMWGATLFDQLACRIRFRQLRYEGPFTPPSTQGTIVYPGNFGVTDWGGIAVDPERQVAFVNPDYFAFVDRLVPQRVEPQGNDSPAGTSGQTGPAGGSDLQASDEHGLNPNKGAPFAVELNPFLSPLGLPCQAPPWGYVAGVDLASGKIVYKHRNGTIRDESPIPVPFKLGVPSLGGPIVTAGNLAFLTSTLDYYIRGYELTSGRELWQARLPAGAQATPMTYWSEASERQFVVAVAGGHGSLGTELGDHVVAYALPREETGRSAPSGR